ncbi:MAG: HU family DNA-binding protein [Solobacterium sp.]|nr:HU family DNA-binding protein [Solobacterium sp.]
MNDVNKKTITETIAETYNFTKKEAAEIVDMVFETMAAALENGDRVDISGFGKFEVKERASRQGINPQTKELIEIPSSRIPGFKASKKLKDRVN